MNIIVCIKQIPEIADIGFDLEKKTLIRDGVRNIINPYDRRAVAEALRIRGQLGGEVTVLTMGPPQSRDALLECLAAGADRAVHLMDRAFAGSDTLATARALALAIQKRPFDLIICGRHSVDAETGQVGPEVAELLGIPQVTGVCRLEIDLAARRLKAERETDEGFETVECEWPALITAAERLIRPIKVKDEAGSSTVDKPIELVTAAELSSDTSIFGFSGSPTSVSEIRSVARTRQVEMIGGAAVNEGAEMLAQRLTARGLFSGGIQHSQDPPAIPSRRAESNAGSGRSVWVVVERAGKGLRPVSLELLGKSTELASRLGGEVVALLIGNDVAQHAQTLAAHGADQIYWIEGERFTGYSTAHYAGALAEAIQQFRPFAVLIPSTANGRDYAPRIAARLGLGLTADCVDLELNEKNELVQFKPAFGGNIIAPILSRTFPQLATVRPGMLSKLAPDWARPVRVHPISASHANTYYSRVISCRTVAAEASIELDDAEVVVCVGMGIGGPENLPLIKELANSLGAAIGGTRRVVDQGWLPVQQQIGLTGRAIAPKLYIGVGVRGAFNHTIGIHRSNVIVNINNDPAADIFQSSDYGWVADFKAAVPALTHAILRVRGQANRG